ncbi:hypothetical protein G9272_14875 [Streptomyces asoensis]|uniref:Uncharacterized protein n=1 Tax=Streptomyces asoensis TaxID=249586 RepID=A0A6M4WM19_9ACTN|nr:hypothetical protein [Streptomyces asoensis]QJT01444.1 hypothetical protein G9272_14875 [Streptomyces asoensis]
MIVPVLTGILVLVLGGCACVWWAARGGPRWARAVAVVTLAAGELVRGASRSDRTGGKSGSDD